VLELLLGQYIEAGVIGALLLLNVTLGFVQETRAGAALAALKKRLAPTAIVRRDGAWAHLAAAELVPGDVTRLPFGALVPADATLVAGAVMIDQSMLTGESVPVDVAPGERVYAGALVRRGQAVAEVTATGGKSYFGRTAELVRVAHAASTEQAATFAATRALATVNGVVVVIVLLSAYLMALPLHDLIRPALTGLLATMPVALPATFALSAALGAQDLAKRGVLLTRLSAAHEAAVMDILCADKTGTLTRNTLQVVDVVPIPGFERERALELAALASSEGDQDPIDAAIRAAAGHTTHRNVSSASSPSILRSRLRKLLHATPKAASCISPRARSPRLREWRRRHLMPAGWLTTWPEKATASLPWPPARPSRCGSVGSSLSATHRAPTPPR
jgi:H+-transporting ATPase